jgi:hypothetical protein
MTAQTLTPAKEAFVALADHCILCPDCKVDLDRPHEKPDCSKAAELYRAWFTLWRKEARP